MLIQSPPLGRYCFYRMAPLFVQFAHVPVCWWWRSVSSHQHAQRWGCMSIIAELTSAVLQLCTAY